MSVVTDRPGLVTTLRERVRQLRRQARGAESLVQQLELNRQANELERRLEPQRHVISRSIAGVRIGTRPPRR